MKSLPVYYEVLNGKATQQICNIQFSKSSKLAVLHVLTWKMCYLAAEVWRSWHLCRHHLSASSLAPWSAFPRRSPRPPYWLLIREKKSFLDDHSLAQRPPGAVDDTAHTSTGSWWSDELFWVLEGFWGCLWPPGLVGPMKNKDRRRSKRGEVIQPQI